MDALKLIRYNTGTDKKLFTQFAKDFDAVIMNATIAAYSGSAMADLVSVYKDSYIIDPQTYILQQNARALISSTSKKGGIKKSISQYLKQLPNVLLTELEKNGSISAGVLSDNLDELVQAVGEFELNYISSFIQEKDYNKYFEFISQTEGDDNIGKGHPKMLIAPYFMLKDIYSPAELMFYINLNSLALNKFIERFGEDKYQIAGQLVIEKGVLASVDQEFISNLLATYNKLDFEYIFLWVDDFSLIKSDEIYNIAFAKIIKGLNSIGKKPIMSYGGYDSILLCSEDSPSRLYGVAQSVGYGEIRRITPVGGGLPVNKYYFPPTHQRLKTEDLSKILLAMGMFDNTVSDDQRILRFHEKICDCDQCSEIIDKRFDNFLAFYESKPFVMKTGIRRNLPTQDALEISARHFLFCKVQEWNNVKNENFDKLVCDYVESIKTYCKYYDRSLVEHVESWKRTYATR